MSSRKVNKSNKSAKIHQPQKYCNNQQNQSQKRLTSQPSNENQPKETSGLVISVHKAWPDLQLNQSRLFFECTLFLYSVLALFLQYLNLYKTLWWLPKSYYQYSMKYHLINPYLLSCIGLLLGVRVTKCFWETLSEKVDYFCKDQDGWQLTCWKVFEYAIVKTPLTTIVCTSFMFSFSRIYIEFGTKALTYFFTPLISYIVLFHNAFINELISLFLKSNAKQRTSESMSLQDRLAKLIECLLAGPQPLVELESVVHLCSDMAERTREEARILLTDFEFRCRYCVFTGLLTAYFAIFMPRALLPMRTNSGHSQFMLIDDIWLVQLFTIVALTALSLYITYLFPINYFDLLYRCAVHLGYWEQIQPVQQPPTTTAISQAQQQNVGHGRHAKTQQNMQPQEVYLDYNKFNDAPYADGTKVIYGGNYYIARSHPHLRTVAAEPGNEAHLRLYRIAKDPVHQCVTYLCLFQGALVAFEFWLLLLTSDWQQIVTLVLLMFANYLLLAKMFKDRVVIGRIYDPSEEDLQLIKQLRKEMEAKKAMQRKEEGMMAEKQQPQQKQHLHPAQRR